MKMKKVLSAVLVTAMAASMAACGGNSTSTTAAAAESTTAAAASSENESTESEATSEAEETTKVAASGDSDWAYIEGKGKMTIGVTMFAPMNYEENGELIGFDTELAKAVCEKIGVEADFIEINWDSKEIELNSKNIDCIWNGMCITEERKQNMSVSDPYLLNTQALVMKADREDAIMADVTGLTVVAEQGSTGEGKLLGDIPDDETVVVSPASSLRA